MSSIGARHLATDIDRLEAVIDVRDRIAGCIYGLLVGDALGCPVEGWTPERIADRYGRLDRMAEPPREPRWYWRPAGLHSDDGQQSMALCDAVLVSPGDTSTAFAELLVKMREARLPPGVARGRPFFGLHRGTGPNFRKSIKALEAGHSPRSSGQLSAGNGVAMLVAPLGLYFRDDADKLRDSVISVAAVKTRDVRAIAAAGAVAAMVRYFVLGKEPEESVLGQLVEFVREVESFAADLVGDDQHQTCFSRALEAALKARSEPRGRVLAGITTRATASAERTVWASHGYCLASVVTSLYLAIDSASFRDALIDTVNLGGDADTTGAMVGAMAGARLGLSSIPSKWLAALHASGAFDDRVEALVDRPADWQPERSLADLESGWAELFVES